VTGPFDGFPDAALTFFEGLEADNSKPYWVDHKAIYDESVRGPMQALLDELAAEFGAGKIFRPHRDVRFSGDKRPYKTQIGAFVPEQGGAGHYVELSADGLLACRGYYAMQSDQVDRYRRAVDDDLQGARLAALVDRLTEAGHDIRGESLKTTPRGYRADHPRSRLLRHKSIYAAHRWTPDDDLLHTPAAADLVRAAWREFSALGEWLSANVGASTSAEGRARR
jgi:uncharacterized protein (TIGR02453 family)